jgi:hydrogenase expression/formation protein HypC
MCLSVPAKIISFVGQQATVEIYGEKRQVYLSVDKAKVGNWVLIHSGIAICVTEDEIARETIDLLTELRKTE